MKRVSTIAISLLLAAGVSDVSAVEKDDGFSDLLAFKEDVDPTRAFLSFDDDYEYALGDQVVDFAREFLGRPYVHGAKGPKAFDCSGFTSYIYKNFGIDLSPSSSTQYTQGVTIDKADVRPGDLLFFKGRNSRANRVGHVALVVDIDPNGVITFIHAAISGGIRYDKFPDGGYYSQRYVGAKRVIE